MRQVLGRELWPQDLGGQSSTRAQPPVVPGVLGSRGCGLARETQSSLGLSLLLPGSPLLLPAGAPALYFCTACTVLSHMSKVPHLIACLPHCTIVFLRKELYLFCKAFNSGLVSCSEMLVNILHTHTCTYIHTFYYTSKYLKYYFSSSFTSTLNSCPFGIVEHA